jgi:hypothetical protein
LGIADWGKAQGDVGCEMLNTAYCLPLSADRLLLTTVFFDCGIFS